MKLSAAEYKRLKVRVRAIVRALGLATLVETDDVLNTLLVTRLNKKTLPKRKRKLAWEVIDAVRKLIGQTKKVKKPAELILKDTRFVYILKGSSVFNKKREENNENNM